MNRKQFDLKRNATALAPLLNIGKNGITDSLVDELLAQLKRDKLVKVKILKSALSDTDRKTIAHELSNRCGAQLVEVRGSSAVLYRK